MVRAAVLKLFIHLECIRILINKKTSAVLHTKQSGQFGKWEWKGRKKKPVPPNAVAFFWPSIVILISSEQDDISPPQNCDYKIKNLKVWEQIAPLKI